MAEKRGYLAAVIEATSVIAHNIASQNDFKVIKEIFYEDMILPSSNMKFDMSNLPLMYF
jgi:hypothetical protein